MQTFHNPHHAGHAGQQEMFRGRMVPCHEVPARLDYVLAELQRRPLGALDVPTLSDAALDEGIGRVHSARYLAFLASAWTEWVAMDPANAQRDALPSVWPLGNPHAFRRDVPPANFAARLGLFSFDSGSPLTAGTWAAASSAAPPARWRQRPRWPAARAVRSRSRVHQGTTRAPTFWAVTAS